MSEPKRYTCNRCGFTFNNKWGGHKCPSCYVESHSIRYTEGTPEARAEEAERRLRELEDENCSWGQGEDY